MLPELYGYGMFYNPSHAYVNSLFGDYFIPTRLSFSPDGYLLASSTGTSVAVWKTEEGGEPKAIWDSTNESNGSRSPESRGPLDHQYHLQWDADSKKMVFAFGHKAIVIRLS